MILDDTTERSPAEPDRPRILLVDDDVILRSLAEHHLGEVGFDVTTLAVGSSLVSTFRDLKPDAILLDVMLPDADGFDLCQALRQIPEAAHTPIVMLTSLNDEPAIRRAFEVGATEFVAKPVNWLHEGHRLRYLLRAAANLRDLEQARETIMQAEKEWERTFDAIEDPILILDRDLVIRRANKAAARVSGSDPNTLPGCPCRDVFQCRMPTADCPARHALSSAAPVHVELHDFGPDKRDCLVAVSPVLDDDGQATGLVYSSKDVTEYRALQKELLHAQKMESVGRLAGGVAHDFNNMLQGILGYTELIELQLGESSSIHDELNEIKIAATRSAELVRQLLAFARKQTAAPTVIDLNATVTTTLAMLGRLIGENIRLAWVPGNQLWTVKIDPTQVGMILANLCVNSRDAIEGTGHITIESQNFIVDQAYCVTHPAAKPGEYVMVAVSDDGCGMDKETLDNIFDPFFTTKEVGKGTGLGLASIHGIAEQNGGLVHVYSELGKGTTFRLYLPRHRPEASIPTAPEEPPAEALPRGTETILVAEDELVILSVCGTSLGNLGYEVLLANTPSQALALAKNHTGPIDLLLTDVIMPEMDGYTLAQRLEGQRPGIAHIYMSGYTANAVAHRGILDREAPFLAKPFNSRQLAEMVRNTLDKRLESRTV